MLSRGWAFPQPGVGSGCWSLLIRHTLVFPSQVSDVPLKRASRGVLWAVSDAGVNTDLQLAEGSCVSSGCAWLFLLPRTWMLEGSGSSLGCPSHTEESLTSFVPEVKFFFLVKHGNRLESPSLEAFKKPKTHVDSKINYFLPISVCISLLGLLSSGEAGRRVPSGATSAQSWLLELQQPGSAVG